MRPTSPTAEAAARRLVQTKSSGNVNEDTQIGKIY